MEQVLCIALSLGLLHGFLVGQEGGTLGKENRKGPQAKVFHRIRCIVAGATVGEAVHDLTQVLHVVIPSVQGFGAHTVSLRGASALRALRKRALGATPGLRPSSLRVRPVVKPTRTQPAAW